MTYSNKSIFAPITLLTVLVASGCATSSTTPVARNASDTFTVCEVRATSRDCYLVGNSDYVEQTEAYSEREEMSYDDE